MLKSKITTREKEVLDLIAHEYTMKEIGSMLYISLHTVICHRKNLQEKLNVKNTAGMIRVAFERGLFSLNHMKSII